MSIKIGTSNISKIYLGTSSISKIYRAKTASTSDLIFNKTVLRSRRETGGGAVTFSASTYFTHNNNNLNLYGATNASSLLSLDFPLSPTTNLVGISSQGDETNRNTLGDITFYLDTPLSVSKTVRASSGSDDDNEIFMRSFIIIANPTRLVYTFVSTGRDELINTLNLFIGNDLTLLVSS